MYRGDQAQLVDGMEFGWWSRLLGRNLLAGKAGQADSLAIKHNHSCVVEETLISTLAIGARQRRSLGSILELHSIVVVT